YRLEHFLHHVIGIGALHALVVAPRAHQRRVQVQEAFPGALLTRAQALQKGHRRRLTSAHAAAPRLAGATKLKKTCCPPPIYFVVLCAPSARTREFPGRAPRTQTNAWRAAGLIPAAVLRTAGMNPAARKIGHTTW